MADDNKKDGKQQHQEKDPMLAVLRLILGALEPEIRKLASVALRVPKDSIFRTQAFARLFGILKDQVESIKRINPYLALFVEKATDFGDFFGTYLEFVQQHGTNATVSGIQHELDDWMARFQAQSFERLKACKNSQESDQLTQALRQEFQFHKDIFLSMEQVRQDQLNQLKAQQAQLPAPVPPIYFDWGKAKDCFLKVGEVGSAGVSGFTDKTKKLRSERLRRNARKNQKAVSVQANTQTATQANPQVVSPQAQQNQPSGYVRFVPDFVKGWFGKKPKNP